jgi:hypothetical protein
MFPAAILVNTMDWRWITVGRHSWLAVTTVESEAEGICGLGVIGCQRLIISGCDRCRRRRRCRMSSSRYWPPISPEDLKKRTEEASVYSN